MEGEGRGGLFVKEEEVDAGESEEGDHDAEGDPEREVAFFGGGDGVGWKAGAICVGAEVSLG